MSIQAQITRLTALKNGIRTALISWGILSDSAADLEDCKEAIAGVANNGAVSVSLDKDSASYTVPAGYHNGAGSVSITTEKRTLTANGTYSPTPGKVISEVEVAVENAPTLQTKSVTPTKSAQAVTPDAGYDGLSSVTVEAIPSNYGDVSGVTADAGDVLANKVFVNASGESVAGTMVNNGAVSATIDGLAADSYTVPAGYHSGTGTVSLTNAIETALAAI